MYLSILSMHMYVPHFTYCETARILSVRVVLCVAYRTYSTDGNVRATVLTYKFSCADMREKGNVGYEKKERTAFCSSRYSTDIQVRVRYSVGKEDTEVRLWYMYGQVLYSGAKVILVQYNAVPCMIWSPHTFCTSIQCGVVPHSYVNRK